ncbi:MAG: hypothetical protein ACREC6_09590 [Hyphomicrobiaceae bacterium]
MILKTDKGEAAHGWEFMGMPVLQILALAGAVVASIVSFETTWSGFHRFYGAKPGVVETTAPLLISLLVQAGIFFASLYLSKRFVQTKTQVRGVRQDVSVSRSLTFLILLLLVPLAAFSVFFSYCTFYDRLLDPAIKYQSRLDRAREDSVFVLNRLGEVIQGEERRLTRAILDNAAYKTWDAGVGQLVTVAAGSGEKIDEFLSGRREEAARRVQDQQRVRFEVAKRKIDLEGDLRGIERDIARLKGEIPQAEQRLTAAEQASADADPEIQRLVNEMKEEKERGRDGRKAGEGQVFRSLKERHDKLLATKKARDTAEKDVTNLKKVLAEKEGRRETIQNEARQAGLQLSGQETSGADTSADPLQGLMDLKLRRVQAVNDLKAAQAALKHEFDAKVLSKAVADCLTLHRPLSRLDAVSKDVAQVDCEAAKDLGPSIRALDEHRKTTAAFNKKGCDSLPARPADTTVDEALVGRLVRELGQYTADCVQLSGLAGKAETGRQIAAINAEIGKIQRTQGSGVDYMTEMSNFLVAGDRSAIMSLALAVMIDGLVFVLAFFGELVKVRMDAAAPVPPLSEHERKRLRRALTDLNTTTDARLDVPRQFVQALRWNDAEAAYQFEASAIRDTAVRNRILAVILPVEGAGRAWRGKGKAETRYSIAERGLYEILTAIEEALAAAAEREAEIDDRDLGQPQPMPAATAAPRQSVRSEPESGRYRNLFDRSGESGVGNGADREKSQAGLRSGATEAGAREGGLESDTERAARAYAERHRPRKR